eukprot:m.34384 g.34384  ORF g.34384 m.34384 type:complete len:299 (+) comp12645_c0_seq1:1360-2256(+)
MAQADGEGAETFGQLLPPLGEMVRGWLAEDIPSFDYGGAVVGDKPETMTLYCKSPGVLAGCPFFDAVMEELDCKVTWNIAEGTHIDPHGDRVTVATVTGSARKLLMGERTGLNILARASGIASQARRLVQIKEKEGWQGVVAGTRKITPGFRLVEKHAMLVGGADAHRMDLSSMVMLKDNHIWSHGSITKAVASARRVCGFSMKIEVETSSVQEAREAIAAGADVVMLDNFEPKALHEVAAILKAETKHVLLEGSGGITEESIASYMSPHIDVLSTSSIHQGVSHVDFSLKVNRVAKY